MHGAGGAGRGVRRVEACGAGGEAARSTAECAENVGAAGTVRSRGRIRLAAGSGSAAAVGDRSLVARRCGGRGRSQAVAADAGVVNRRPGAGHRTWRHGSPVHVRRCTRPAARPGAVADGADLRAVRTDIREGVVNGCAWIADGIGYAVVASLPDEAPDAIADQVHREVREPAEVRRASIGVRLSAGHPSRAAMRNEANGDNCTAQRSEAVRQRGARQSLPRSHPLAGPIIPINVV